MVDHLNVNISKLLKFDDCKFQVPVKVKLFVL